MPEFNLRISDGRDVETSVNVPNAQEAVNAALNAMTQFACKRFPPPENFAIKVTDAERQHVATLRFEFSIEYGEGISH